MTPRQFDTLLRSAIANDPRSVRALAMAAGVSYPSVSHYLNQTRGITWDTATKLLSELGFRLDRPERP